MVKLYLINSIAAGDNKVFSSSPAQITFRIPNYKYKRLVAIHNFGKKRKRFFRLMSLVSCNKNWYECQLSITF